MINFDLNTLLFILVMWLLLYSIIEKIGYYVVKVTLIKALGECAKYADSEETVRKDIKNTYKEV